MKKFILICLTFAYILSALTFPAFAAEESAIIMAPDGSCKSLDAVQSLLGNEPIVDNADSIVLFETKSQTLMYAMNADTRIDPASLVKIMTGLLVSENATLSDAVTISADVLSSISSGAATQDLQVEEVLTVEDLLYCMLVSSANDAAAALAAHIAGSQSAFVEKMNDRASELGCLDTHFVNAHGLYDENQYSTARDMAKILNAAMANEIFRKVFGTTHYTVPATNKHEPRILCTGNYLMSTDDVQVHFDERVIGGRTGITDAGYRNLATAAQSGNMELICILTGAASVLAENGYSVQVFGGYSETSTLLSKGFDGMSLKQVIREDQVVAQKSVLNGECDVILGPVESVFTVLPTNVKIRDLTYQYPENQQLQAPITKGDIVSTVEIWHNDLCVAETDLYAMNSVDVLESNAEDGVAQESDNGMAWWIVLTVVGVVMLVIVLRWIGRTVRSRRRRKMHQNHRRSR